MHMMSVAWAQSCSWIKLYLSMYKSEYIVELIVLAAEFMILKVQIHLRQGYHGGGDLSQILHTFCHSHLTYGLLVRPDDVASLKYRSRFWKPRYLVISYQILQSLYPVHVLSMFESQSIW